MGAVAVVPEVKTAFFGLGGTTALLFLFGLRTIGRRPLGRDISSPEEDDARMRTPVSEIPTEVHERKDLESFADEEQKGDVLDSVDAIAMSRRGRERDVVAHATGEVGELGGRGDGAGDPPAPLLMRERAERGAAIAKVETDMRAEMDELRSGLAALRREFADGRAGDGADAPDDEDGESAPRLPDMTAFLRKDDFNRAVNQRLLPTIEDRIVQRIREAITPAALRTALQDPDGVFDATATPDLGNVRQELTQTRELAEKALRFAAERPASVRTDAASGATVEHDESVHVLQTRVDALEGLLRVLLAPGPDEDLSHIEPVGLAEHLRNKFESQGQLLESTASELAVLSARLGEVRNETSALSERTGGDASPETEAEVTELRERVQRLTARSAKTAKKVDAIDDLQNTLGQVIAEVSRIGEELGALSRRVEKAPDSSMPPPPADSRNEVAELRDALSLIINESRELRAQRARPGDDGRAGDPA